MSSASAPPFRGGQVRSVSVGGPNPIVVQSMTNTDTADTVATVNQVMALARLGSNCLQQLATLQTSAAKSPTFSTIGRYARQVRRARSGDRRLPLQRTSSLEEVSGDGASAREVSHQSGQCKHRQEAYDDNFRIMIEAAIQYDRPVRIGVNWGSLDQALLTRMMDANNKLPEPLVPKAVTPARDCE